MAEAVIHTRSEIEDLSAPDRTELRQAMMERIRMSEELTEEDFGALAADMFRRLDAEDRERVADIEARLRRLSRLLTD